MIVTLNRIRCISSWCFLLIVAFLALVEISVYMNRSGMEKHVVYSRRSEQSLCPLKDTVPHASTSYLHYYRCKIPRKKLEKPINPKKFVISRFIGEANSTVSDNMINLVANSLDLRAQVLEKHPLISNRCTYSDDKCDCWCMNSLLNCTQFSSQLSLHLKCTNNVTEKILKDDLFLQKSLCDAGLPSVVSLSTFIHNSYRSIVVIKPIYEVVHKKFTSEWDLIQKLRYVSPITECCDFEPMQESAKDILTRLNAIAETQCQPEFTVVGCYCIAAWYKSNDLSMYWFADADISIAFTSWLGLERDDSDIVIIEEEKEEKEPSSPAKPTATVPVPVDSKRRRHSNLAKLVIQQTKKYMQSLANGKQYFVVHIHLDNGPAESIHKMTNFKECLMKVKQSVEQHLKDYPDLLLFFFTDDKLSEANNLTDSAPSTAIKELLLGQENEFQHYSPKVYGGRSDTPFVTLVEQEFMCRASFLLTVGGGKIQERIKRRFLKMHFHKKLLDFKLCLDSSIPNE